MMLVLASLVAAGARAADPLDAKAELGRRLFFDPGLSASGKLACASCHNPHYAYGPPPGKALAVGGARMRDQGTRAVPSLRYLRSSPEFSVDHKFSDGDVGPVGGFTWDGRAATIREQARLPLLAANEMANPSPRSVVKKVRASAYAGEFRAVFGEDIFDESRRAFAAVLDALGAFQSIPAEFFPYSSRYDAFLRGEIELTEQEERGVALFKDLKKGNCASCHIVSSRAGVPPTFTDYDFANVGAPRNHEIHANANPRYYDLGLCGPLRRDLAAKKEYCGFFRAPTLRNVAIRDAFFHNGVFHTLHDTLVFYVERDLYPEKYYSHKAGGRVRQYDDFPADLVINVDHDPPFDRKPGDAPALTDAEIEDLQAFLETLTDQDALR